MNRNDVIFYALLVLLCILAQSCKRFSLYSEKDTPLHYSALKTITDTMACCPEAALDILIDVSDTVDESKLSKPDYYEYQILIAEALYKKDLLQTNDSAVFEAVRYYDSLAQIYPKNVEVILQKSRAHYYKAVGESEKDDIKNACADYIISLKTIDEIKEKDRNYNIDYFNGLIYNRLANIYYYNDAFTVARYLYHKANESYIKINDIQPVAYNYLCIAKMLSTIDLYEEEEKCLNIADSLITYVLKIEDNQTKRKILMERALLASYRDNDNKKAMELARQYMSKADGEEERVLGYTQLGEIFYKDCQYDSALYYFEKDFLRNHYTMLHCGNRIIEICKISGDNEKAAYYAPLLAEETNQELELTPMKAELVAMYEQYEADKHKAKTRELWLNIIMALTVGAIILVVVFSVVFIIRKRRHKNEIDSKDRYIRTLHGKMKQKSEENKNVNEDYVKEAHQPIPFNERMQNIKRDDLCRKLYSITQMHIKTTAKYTELVLSDDEKMYLIGLFDKELNGTLQSIIRNNQRLKNSDELLFCLCLLGLDDKHISAVIGSPYHNVYVRTQKCRQILRGDKDLQSALITTIIKS